MPDEASSLEAELSPMLGPALRAAMFHKVGAGYAPAVNGRRIVTSDEPGARRRTAWSHGTTTHLIRCGKVLRSSPINAHSVYCVPTRLLCVQCAARPQDFKKHCEAADMVTRALPTIYEEVIAVVDLLFR